MERDALKKMEVASEKIVREFSNLRKAVHSANNSTEIITILRENNIDKALLPKLLSILDAN